MKIEWDFKELYDFADKLTKEEPLDTAMMTATREIAKVLHRHLLKLTPVDTGNLRKMWSAGENLRFTVKEVPGGFEVVLVNKARSRVDLTKHRSDPSDESNGFMYGVAVNDGHKTPNGGYVKGRFFVENATMMTKGSRELNRIIQRELAKWWEGL